MRIFRPLVLLFASLFAVFFLSVSFLSAEEILVEETGYILDLPVGWEIMDYSDNKLTFIDFTGDAFMQIKTYAGDSYSSPEEMFNEICTSIDASGEGDFFPFNGGTAVFGIIDFTSGEFQYSGYALFLEGESSDVAVLSFSSADKAELLNDYILSALDSFSLNQAGRTQPGPVSSYYYASFGSRDIRPARTQFEGTPVRWQVDMTEVETSQLLIEREARILADYKPQAEETMEAWRRFYRMIYRDCYSRLDETAELLSRRFSVSDDPRTTAQRILSWLQEFNYRRTEGSDLITPLHAAAFEDGDCDSRAMLYSILLHHMGIDSFIMVSAIYGHGMAAVDVPGPGARMPYGNRAYLVAETTENVDIGMIAADMADPTKWVVVPFLETID